MFFSLCRAVRTTAKKKKNYNLTVTRVRRFFLSQLAVISQSDWPVPFSIGMQTTLLASTCECQHWKVLEMDALISTSLDLPEICRQTNAKEPYWLHVVCYGQLNLTKWKKKLNHFIPIAEINWTVSDDILQRLREECM